MKKYGFCGSNEGGLSFRENAYRYAYDLSHISIEKCQDVILDLHGKFQQIIEYETKKHNVAVEHNEKQRHIESYEEAPGYKLDDLVISEMSQCLIPTDILMDGGKIYLNQNFIKIMKVLKDAGLNGFIGTIFDFTHEETDDPIGNMYDSILYSLAIHTVRGHFPINVCGFHTYSPDEATAQNSRGKSHAYINLMAMMFYWIIIVEMQENDPREHSRMFMFRHKEVFDQFNKDERGDMPGHMEAFTNRLVDEGILPLDLEAKPTELTKDDVEEFINNMDNASS
jgi:hypothetical protein